MYTSYLFILEIFYLKTSVFPFQSSSNINVVTYIHAHACAVDK